MVPCRSSGADSEGKFLKERVLTLTHPGGRLQTFPGPGGNPLRAQRPESSCAAARAAAWGNVCKSKRRAGDDGSGNRAWWGRAPHCFTWCGMTLGRDVGLNGVDNPSFHGVSQPGGCALFPG
jgi:hypothetical protein